VQAESMNRSVLDWYDRHKAMKALRE